MEEIDFVGVFNMDANEIPDVQGLCWSKSSNLVYFTNYNDAMYKLDISSQTHTQIMEFCDSKRYEVISCSNDGNKLVGERVDSYLARNEKGDPTGEIIQKSRIYIIDLATMEETPIELL